METLNFSLPCDTPLKLPYGKTSRQPKLEPKLKSKSIVIVCSVTPDPWTLSDGNNRNIVRPKPKSKNPKNPLPDDNARRIIKAKAQYLRALRRNQGSRAQTPNWIRRTPEQMVNYLEDDRNGQLFGKHVVAAIKRVRSLSGKADGSYDMREVMGTFVTKLTFREMCIVLKEQKGWRQVRDFFAWMKLQLSYRHSVVAYTIVLRMYGQVGKIKLAEQTFLEMLEAGCEPDEVACGTMLCAYSRWGRHKAMLSFFSAVQERGILPSVAVFNFMLSSLQKKSLHGNVIGVWKQMVDKRVVPNHFTYTVVISSLVKRGLFDEALKAFDSMKNLGFVPEEVTYSLLISLSSKNGNKNEAVRLYEEMRSHGIVPSNFTYASLLSLHYKNVDYPKALSLFSEMGKNKVVADEVIYGLLIRIYGKLGLYEDAEETFKEIEKLGLLSDEKTYITMAQVLLNSGNFERALSVMEQMKSRNILFSRFGYIVLLRCYAKKDDLASAEITYQAQSKTGLPDSGSSIDMIDLYIRLGLMEKAKNFIAQLRKDKVEFDEALLKTVTKLYCKEGMLSEMEQLMEEVNTSGSLLDSEFYRSFSVAMHGNSDKCAEFEFVFECLDHFGSMAFELMLTLHLAGGDTSKLEEKLKLLLKATNGLSVASQLVSKFIREGDSSKAEFLYELLIKLGCKPEETTTASMISLYGKQQKLDRAREIFSVIASSSSAGKPLYTSMIDAYAKCSQAVDAYAFYQGETKEGHDLGAVAISMLVNALTNCGKYREAENVIRGSICNNMELDTVAYNTFIKAMLEAGKLHFAVSIYEHMLSSGVSPSIQTYNTMISVYGRGRNLEKSVEMFNIAQTMGFIDEKAYSNLICYYGKAGKIHEASLLFNKMQDEGIKPGQVSYNIMINVYATAGLHQKAEELFNIMHRADCQPDSLTYLALVRAYTKGLKYSEAEKAIVLMQGKGIAPSCAHFNLLILAYTKTGQVEEAERIYQELIATGLTPDLACCRAILRGYMDYGHVQKGISFFESIYGSVEPDRFVMSAAVHLFGVAGMTSRADGVLSSMNALDMQFLKNLEVGASTKTS